MNFLVSSQSILLIVRTIYAILLRLLSQIPEQEYFAQSLMYHRYCDATDLESDYLISPVSTMGGLIPSIFLLSLTGWKRTRLNSTFHHLLSIHVLARSTVNEPGICFKLTGARIAQDLDGFGDLGDLVGP